MTNQKSGLSALGLQRLLGLGSYKTAWMCLHKLRRAMVRLGREPLQGPVEVDETFIGGPKRLRRDKICVFVAAEIRKKAIGRIRLKLISNHTEESIIGAIRELIAPGSVLLSDGAHAYKHAVPLGYLHHRTVVDGKTKKESTLTHPRVHRVSSLLKRWLLGAHQGRVSRKQIDHYLDEFVFRFNRRLSQQRGMLFYRLLQQAVKTPPAPYKKIKSV
jgi:transposase-like protein